jgi:Flp pilus assembly protein TadG
MCRLGSCLNRLRADRRGVAAVEFALLVPLLLSLYFVTMEVSQAVETSKKVSRVASMTADLVTQQSSITQAEVKAVMDIGEALLQPYNRSAPAIMVTAIQMSNDATPKATVVWSRKLKDGAHSAGIAKGTELTDVPAKLKVAGTFLVRVESALEYRPVVTWTASEKTTLGLTAAFDKIQMGDTYYLRPRMSDAVPCADC